MTTSFRVDRDFREVGRINLVSGAKTKVEHDSRNATLTKLDQRGMYDILRAIKSGLLTIGEVHEDDVMGRLEFSLERATLRKPLWAQVEAWVPTSAAAPASRSRYDSAFKFLRRTGVLGGGAVVSDLERVDWRALFNAGLIGPTGWNRMRGAVSAFLSSVLRDKYHPFRRSVVARFPKAEEPERVPDLPVGLFWTILNHIPPALRPCYVTMVAAGLGPKEFVTCGAADLLPDSFGLLVTGHKNGRKGKTPVYFSEALWQWVTAAVPCPVSKDLLADHWKRACRKAGRGDLRLYDLRHCFGQWLTNAGVPDALIQTGMRHRTAGMTRRYTKQVHKGQTAAAMGTLLVVPPLALASGA